MYQYLYLCTSWPTLNRFPVEVSHVWHPAAGLYSASWLLMHADRGYIQQWMCVPLMDEGTLKTPIPKCRLYWSFLFGVVKQFYRFWTWSETECKTPAEYGLQHNSTHPPPPPQPYTVCIYCTVSLGRGRGGEGGQREDRGATVHKYSSFVHGGNSSQAGSKIPTMSLCISSL